MSDASDEIRNLIYRYAEAFDTGRFELIDELFADAQVRWAFGNGLPGAPMSGALAQRARDREIVYADGTPRTTHVITNLIIEVEEEAGTAASRCYNTTLQQVPGHPIEILAAARYEDRFERAGDRWRFTERVIRFYSIDGVHRDFVGDMSRHLRQDAAPNVAPGLEDNASQP